MKRLLTYNEVVQEYGVNVWFWRSQVWKGRLKNCGFANKHLLDRRDIEKLLEQNKASRL